MPFVGTVIDAVDLVKNPSWANAGLVGATTYNTGVGWGWVVHKQYLVIDMITKNDFLDSIHRSNSEIKTVDLYRWIRFVVKIGFVSQENIDWKSINSNVS